MLVHHNDNRTCKRSSWTRSCWSRRRCHQHACSSQLSICHQCPPAAHRRQRFRPSVHLKRTSWRRCKLRWRCEDLAVCPASGRVLPAGWCRSWGHWGRPASQARPLGCAACAVILALACGMQAAAALSAKGTLWSPGCKSPWPRCVACSFRESVPAHKHSFGECLFATVFDGKCFTQCTSHPPAPCTGASAEAA